MPTLRTAHKGKPTKKALKRVTRSVPRAYNNPAPRLSPGARNFRTSYLDTLCDPFEYGAIKLGYDNFTSSDLATAYYRSSLTVNADGSFGLYSFPNVVGSFVKVNNSGDAVATWAGGSASNYTTFQSNYASARCLSGGIRAFALFPATSAPGVLFAGAVPDVSTASLDALTPATLRAMPGATIGIGNRGAISTMRPQDNDSFVFWTYPVNGYSTAQTSPVTVPWISGVGFPAGTIIWYEIVQNYECLTKVASSIATGANFPNQAPTASDFFPSPESLFASVKNVLGNSAVMDGAATLAELAHPGSGRLIRGVSRAFGTGRASLSSGAGTQTSQFVSRNNAVMIEEMKEDSGADEYQMVKRRR